MSSGVRVVVSIVLTLISYRVGTEFLDLGSATLVSLGLGGVTYAVLGSCTRSTNDESAHKS